MRSSGLRLLAFVTVVSSACGGRDPIVLSPQEIPAPAVDSAGVAYESPARWVYAPAVAADPRASLVISGGRCIVAGDQGERWLTQRRTKASGGAACAGGAQAASALAPERLVGIVRRSETSWMFIGQSGTLYEADAPLAPFSRRIRPPRPFERVIGNDAGLLAVGDDGLLYRWDDTGTWVRTALHRGQPAPGSKPGDLDGRLIDVALAADRRALALTVPEQLWTSIDAGKTWKQAPPATAPRMGLHRLGVTADGHVAAEGVARTLVWRDASAVRLEAVQRQLEDPPTADGITVGQTRSISAIFEGRARLTQQRYYEVRAGFELESLSEAPEADQEAFYLLGGELDAPLRTSPLPDSGSCDQMRIGAHGRVLVVTCARTRDDELVADVARSRDGGETWADVATLRTSRADEIRVAVGPEGQALVTATCARRGSTAADRSEDAHRAADDARGERAEGDRGAEVVDDADDGECEPGPPVLITADDEVIESAAPHLLELALRPAFSPDGQRAYFLARRLKDERFSIFASRDGGRTFTQRAIELPHLATSADEEPEAAPDPTSDPAIDLELAADAPLSVDDDGLIGITAMLGGEELYLVADEDGRVLRSSRGPSRGAFMAGVGKRVLAVGQLDDDTSAVADDRVHAWESLDAGETWTEIPATLALASGFQDGLFCAVGGCIVGASVARVGWGGQVEGFSSAMELDAPLEVRRAVREPLLCELSSETGWRSIPRTYHHALPHLSETYRGTTAWSALSFDPATGALEAYAMQQPEPGTKSRLVQRTMFKGHGRGQPIATEIAFQMEGYAAARARVSLDAEGRVVPGSELRDVEIAWENWMDGTSGRRTLATGGPLTPGRVKRGEGGLELETALLSVSPGGLFIRPSELEPDTFFLDAGSAVERFDYADWGSVAPQAHVRSDAAAVGAARFSVGMVHGGRHGALVGLLARDRSGGRWDLQAQTLGPSPGLGRTLTFDWTYRGGAIGLSVTGSDPISLTGWSSFYPFGEDGRFAKPETLPTPYDIDGRARACTADDLRDTARSEGPVFTDGEVLFPGTRHPVVVIDSVSGPAAAAAALEPVFLLTDGMVLHGTKADPCVAGFRAEGIRPTRDIAAVIPGDLGSDAWLLRASGPDGTTLEYRPMRCRFDPTSPIPEQVWQHEGTSVLR